MRLLKDELAALRAELHQLKQSVVALQASQSTSKETNLRWNVVADRGIKRPTRKRTVPDHESRDTCKTDAAQRKQPSSQRDGAKDVRRVLPSPPQRYLRKGALQSPQPTDRRDSRAVYNRSVRTHRIMQLRRTPGRAILRDRLVVGIADQALSERLQLKADLTLDDAKKIIRQKEAVHDQHQQLRSSGDGTKKNPIELDAVSAGRPRTARRKPQQKPWSSKPQGGASGSSAGKQPCKRCGKEHLKGDRCPAMGVACFKCNHLGHFGAQCLSKTVGESTQELEAVFLGALTETGQSAWKATVQVLGQPIQFKMDTGAEVTAINEDTFKRFSKVQLQRPTRRLLGPSQQPLEVTGQFQASLTKADRASTQTIFIVPDLKSNLLGLPALIALRLISQIDSVEDTKDHILEEFPALFRGLGNLGEEYHIKMWEGLRPYALFNPIPLRTKVKEALDRMEELGVIAKLTEPTLWCVGMVVVPKKSGSVRICVDLKPLNKGVLGETYPIPPVDDTLTQLAGAAVFSKVDTNSGFWQIPLADDSQLLTTFITPHGRYCFRKLPFGISSAPELYQRRMSQILSGLDGIVCHIDDVLIYGNTQEEHHTRLHAALSHLQTAGVTLNADKCLFSQTSIKFLRHVIDKHGVRPDPERVEYRE